MGLPPVGQPPEENCYDCFYACRPNAAVIIKVGLGLESVVWLVFGFWLDLQLELVSGLYNLLCYLATVR